VLSLIGCKGLIANKKTVLPALFAATQSGKIKGLILENWPLKNGDLPEGLNLGGLILSGCTGITRLPEKLDIKWWFHLEGCSGLMANKNSVLPPLIKAVQSANVTSLSLKGWPLTKEDLPKNLSVKGDLQLDSCTGLDELPEGLGVGEDLMIQGCTGLTGLPEGLRVGKSLWINGCTGLTHLPKELRVGDNLYLSKDLNKQVKKDARALKKNGKIKGRIF
jgi:hypothetical protein